jgi:starch synthase
LFGMITRMDSQKGVDLAVQALEQLAHQRKFPWRAVILGTGLTNLEEAVLGLQARFPDRVRAIIKFDAPLSHRIYAGVDALLMPSRYEPCGLAQMIAMRYGCIPLARATGGLADTIVDVAASPDSTGFLFNEASASALLETLKRCLTLYQDQAGWQALQQRGMAQDFSWQRSAVEYLKCYESLVISA